MVLGMGHKLNVHVAQMILPLFRMDFNQSEEYLRFCMNMQMFFERLISLCVKKHI